MDWLDQIGDVASSINPLNIAGTAIGKLVNGIFNIIAGLVSDAVGGAVSSFATMWMKVPTPTVSGGDTKAVNPGDVSGIMQVLGYVKWISFIMAVFAIIILTARWAVKARRGDGENAFGRLGVILVAVIGISSATALVTMVLQTGPTRVGGVVGKLQAHLWFYMLVAASLSVMVGMVRLMMARDTQPADDTLKSLIRLLVVAGAGTTLVQLSLNAGDSFSNWLLEAATGGDFKTAVTKYLAISGTMPGGALLIIILGLLSLIACLVQVALMILRSGLLVVMTGVLPLASANTNTDWGMNWYHKSLGWLAAFVLYKPVASIIYATCFWMISGGAFGDQQGSIAGPMVGFVFMIASIVALPALMKFAVPAVSAMGSGSGGGGMASAAPSGAMMLARGSSGSGASSSSTTASGVTAGPSGASSAGASSGGSGAAAGGAGSAASGAAAGAGAAAGPVGAGVSLAAGAVKKGQGAVEAEAGGGTGGTVPSGAAPAPSRGASAAPAEGSVQPSGTAGAPPAPSSAPKASGAGRVPDRSMKGGTL
jgi:type IV secretion system protein TrbL